MSAYDDLVRILCEECGDPLADRIARRIRALLGSQSIYVPSRGAPDVTRKDTVETIRKRHGVSRSTAYNWLNKYRL